MNQKTKQEPQEKTVTMELSAVKIQQFNKQPIIECLVYPSEDGNWIINEKRIKDIKHRSYYESILNGLKAKKKEA